ncbi:type II secretion system ATPase GspE [Melaminivora sp.]
MSALPPDAPSQESELLAQFSRQLHAPLLNTLGRSLSGISPVPGLSPAFLRAHGLLPLTVSEEAAEVAATVPVQLAALDALRQFFPVPVQLTLAPREWIASGLEQVYRGDALDGMAFDAAPEGDEDDDDLETLKALAEDAPVVRLVQSLLLRAVESRASDLHLEISQQRFRVRYRIDGVLFDAESPPRRMYTPAISHLKLRAKMNIAERRLPQDGRMQAEMAGRQIDMRVSTVPTAHGESMVIRLLDQGPGLMSLESLGLAPDHLTTLEAAVTQPHGMILVTGPTGSGKTSTLYAALSRVNRPENKIITVEDPVEYQIDGINQIQVKPQIELTFASALRSIVRQDPDIIMVGEVRDQETAEISIQSALTGHLVLSTLHTNDSFGAPHRLMDMGVESYLIASSVVLIVAQRLVRVICPHCKEATTPTEADRLFMAEEGVDARAVTQLFHGRGCHHCGQSGYIGRTGIYEMLPMSTAIKEAIIKKLPAEGVRRVASQEGVRSMRADGIRKVLEGMTTLEELARVTRQELA